MERYGLLGEHLGHSFSPQIHKAIGGYDYELFEVPPERLEKFLKTGEFRAINVTIPYKKAVIPYCAALSPQAAEIGSGRRHIVRGQYGLLRLFVHSTQLRRFSGGEKVHSVRQRRRSPYGARGSAGFGRRGDRDRVPAGRKQFSEPFPAL